MESSQAEGGRRRLAEVLGRAGRLVESDPVEAEAAATEACELAAELEDEMALGEGRYVRGTARLRLGRYEQAESDLRLALDGSRKLGATGLTLRALRKLLQCAFYTRNPDAALLRGLQALQVARDAGELAAEAEAHNDLGLVYGNLGDYEGALEHLLAGLRILREEGSTKLGSLLNNVGNVHFELGDFREAFDSFRFALDAFRDEGGILGAGIALGNLGRASEAQRRHEEAADWYEQSLAEFERAGDPRYIPPAYARLGGALAAQGAVREAEAAFAEGFRLIEAGTDREFEDEILTTAARFELARHRIDVAIGMLERALALVPSGETTRRLYELHDLLADAHERRGDHRSALASFKEFQRVRQAVADSAMAVRVRGLMLQFDVEQARQQEEIYRLRNVELAKANEELRRLQERLEEKNRELHRITIEDSLTGLRNRRYVADQLPQEIKRAKRHGRPLCVAMCDIDHFKSVNDDYSHAFGDDVLRRIAKVFLSTARESDTVSRYGGEEFLVILPDTDLAGAEVLAERIRAAVSELVFGEVAPGLRVSMSIGIAQLTPGRDERELLAEADARLYEAKRSGRNRIVT
jgi:diguanylate cyclase (GGDEF)-like protein